MSSAPSAAPMRFASAVSERVDTKTAVREAVAELSLDASAPPDLVLVHASPHHGQSYPALASYLREALGGTRIAGCSAAGVVGAGRELEHREGLSITAMHLPDTRVHLVHLPTIPESDSAETYRQVVGPTASATPHFLLYVDPQTEGVERLLRGLDAAFPSAVKVGGLVSGHLEDRGATLFVDERTESAGALLVVLDGNVEVHAVVTQGCKPVGEPSIVTRTRGNIIVDTNAGKPAELLRKLYDSLDAHDQQLWSTSLFLGIEMQSQSTAYTTGDFLVRNILGVDRESGALAVDTRVQDYQVVQFQLRDKDAASQDLAQRLRALSLTKVAPRIAGALLFSCLGRGERLFGVPNHDSDSFTKRVSPVSLSGFFCNGEIGPVGSRTFVHGYTSVFAVFCRPLTGSQPT